MGKRMQKKVFCREDYKQFKENINKSDKFIFCEICIIMSTISFQELGGGKYVG